jgi:hypothetical protein
MPTREVGGVVARKCCDCGADRSHRAVLAEDVTVDIETAGEMLGLRRTKTRALAREGRFPVPVVVIEGRYRVPTAGLRELLGMAA